MPQQPQQPQRKPSVEEKPLYERFEICPNFYWKQTAFPFMLVQNCLLIDRGEPCNRVNYDEQAYPWGLCISLPLQKDKEA